MKQFHIPYKKSIHYVLLGFFGIPLLVFSYSYLFNEHKFESSLRGILWYILPTVIMALLLLPRFTFKQEENGSEEKAILKLPFIEVWIWLILGNLFLTLFAGIASYIDDDPVKLNGMIFYSLPLIAGCFYLLNSHTILFKGDYLTKKEKRDWEKKKSSLGSFSYTEKGFRFTEKNIHFSSDWKDIASILAYKEDLYVVDRICLKIQQVDGTHLCISEETDGYFIFKEKMYANLEGIQKNWEFTVMLPAFELSPTWVYQKREELSE